MLSLIKKSASEYDAPPLPELALEGKDILVLSPTPTYPLDAGNRKRIYHYCRELQKRGARIHFIYYPFEWWFTCVPHDHIREMTAQWESFHYLPVTKPLQAPPGGEYHNIDEWWDWEAIEPTLKWLFQRGHYDAFIVNYAYLSKAFEFVPDSKTVRILDTHDKFTGRREMLESMGVAPEFFYTTAEQEKIALDRADLIWAIKDEEAEFFRALTKKPVITMPHVEPAMSIERRRSPEDEDYLVLGMVGARNSVNYRNATAFIKEVLPVLSRHLAPIKIRFGGGMCSDLEVWDEMPTGIGLSGRFDQPEDFYSTVDAILVPLAFSTGLKIKAVEAFALGMPVIANKHAVEGIPVTHDFHQCASSADIARACIDLAFDPNRLSELRAATVDTYKALNEICRDAFDFTIRKIIDRSTIVFAVAPEFLDQDSVYRSHVLETYEYLRWLAEPVFYFDRPLPGGFQRWTEQFNWLASNLKAVISPVAAKSMGLTDDPRTSKAFPLLYTISTLEAFCAKQKSASLWLLDLPQEMIDGKANFADITDGYLRLDVLRQLGKWNEDDILAVVQQFPKLKYVSNTAPESEALVAQHETIQYLQVPYWYRGDPWQLRKTKRSAGVWILATLESLPHAARLLGICRKLRPEEATPTIFLPNEQDLATAKLSGLDIRTAECLRNYTDLLADINSLKRLPNMILNLSLNAAHYSVLGETTARKLVPWLEIYPSVSTSQPYGNGNLALEPQTIAELVEAIEGNDDQITVELAKTMATTYQNDAGWQYVWKAISAGNALS